MKLSNARGLMRRADDVGRSGRIGASLVLDAQRRQTARAFAPRPAASQHERMQEMRRAAIDQVIIACSLVESSRERVAVAKVQVERMLRRHDETLQRIEATRAQLALNPAHR